MAKASPKRRGPTPQQQERATARGRDLKAIHDEVMRPAWSNAQFDPLMDALVAASRLTDKLEYDIDLMDELVTLVTHEAPNAATFWGAELVNYLACDVVQQLALAQGQTSDEAKRTAKRYWPKRYRLSVDNPIWIEFPRPNAYHDAAVPHGQRQEVTEFQTLMLAEDRRGRTPGSRDWSRQQWFAENRRLDTKFANKILTDRRRADEIGLSPKTYSTYKNLYGDPHP
jgi:hypothetical protein